MSNHRYPQRLHHNTPEWVPEGAVFHIRIRSQKDGTILTTDSTAKALLNSVAVYADQRRWSCFLFLIMPDHIHGLFSCSTNGMSRLFGNWKRYHANQLGIMWQDNFYDHRIRSQQEFTDKFNYIRLNPVVKGLCETPDDWPWQTIQTQAQPVF
jgi:putative transposase